MTTHQIIQKLQELEKRVNHLENVLREAGAPIEGAKEVAFVGRGELVPNKKVEPPIVETETESAEETETETAEAEKVEAPKEETEHKTTKTKK